MHSWPDGHCTPQVDGAVTSGPDLSVEVNGLKLPNPFVIASGVHSLHWLRHCLPVYPINAGSEAIVIASIAP